MGKWYQLDKERFEMERSLLDKRGFVLDEAALAQRGRVEFSGSIDDGTSAVVIRIICPDGFPYDIPLFLAPDLPLTPETRHIGLRNHLICLRFMERGSWRHWENIASLIDDAAGVLRAQHTKEFGEQHRAPDQDLFPTRHSPWVAILPDDLSALPQENTFSCVLSSITDKVFLVSRVGQKQTEYPLQALVRSNQAVKVFKLKEVPIAALRSFDDLLAPATNDWRSVLSGYAFDDRAVAKAYPALLREPSQRFGVVFPFQDGQVVWQFFEIRRAAGKKEIVLLFRTAMTSHLSSRISTSIDVLEMSKAEVVVVGAGALGSTVAVELACAGIGKLTVYDNDTVSIGNVVRHEASIAEIGMPKAEFVRRRILLKNPGTHVTAIVGDALVDDRFEETVRSASLVVVTVAEDNVETYVNEICVRYGTPAIYGYVGMHAAVGHVIRTLPKDAQTGCLECFSRLYYASNSVIPRLPEPADANEVVVELGCNNPALPGAGFDIKWIADAIVRKSAQTILRHTETYPDDGADIVVIGNRTIPSSTIHSLQVRKFLLEPNENCSTCGKKN